MPNMRKLSRFGLRTLLVFMAIAGGLAWWFGARPQQQIRDQTNAGRRIIHDRDRVYLESVFDEEVKSHLVTVIGDSRLTHWNDVSWIECPTKEVCVTYGSDHALLVWNRQDGSILNGFYDVQASAYAPGIGTFFMSTPDALVRTWSLGDDLAIDEAVDLPVGDYVLASCSPNGRFLVFRAKSSDSQVTVIWDRETKSDTLVAMTRYGTVAFSPDSERLLLIDHNSIKEHECTTGKLVAEVPIPEREQGGRARVSAAVSAGNGDHLYLGDAAGRVLVYSWKDKEIVREMDAALSTVNGLHVKDDESAILVAADRVHKHFKWGPNRTRHTVLLNEDATEVYAGENGLIACIRQGRLVEMSGENPKRMVGGPRVDATCFAFSPSGDRIALAGRDGQIVIRETAKWERVQSWRAHHGWIRRLVWSPREDRLVSMADDAVLAMWDPRTGDEVQSTLSTIFPHRMIASFDREGKRFAAYSVTKGLFLGVSIVDADTFDILETIPHTALSVRGNFILSSDARRLYAGGSQATVNVWSFDDSKIVKSFGARTLDEVKLALNDEEDAIFTAYAKNVVAFELPGGKPLWTVPVHNSLISDISLHPSRPLLVTGGNDGTVALVDTESGKLIRKMRLGPTRGDILQVDFSPDGKLLAIAMSNGAVVVLRTPSD